MKKLTYLLIDLLANLNPKEDMDLILEIVKKLKQIKRIKIIS